MKLVLANLSDVLALPDEEAADALNKRMAVFDEISRLHERSFVERGIIIREFERRQLWKHLEDPETGEAFPSLTAWLSCDKFLGGRRINFEAKRTLAMLEDVPPTRLMGIPKCNLHTLTQLSTAVRNQPDVLEAARNLPREEFEGKVEKDHPAQHIQAHRWLKFSPDRSGAKAIEEAIAWALEHDIAGSRDEAIVRACEAALHEWELEEELKSMPVEEADVS
jgi:hypothetical protein